MSSGPTTLPSPGRTPVARVAWVDSARGLAIVLVVLYHSANWLSSVGLPVREWLAVNDALVSVRMPLFFTTAGLFAAKWFTAGWGPLWRAKLSLYLWVLLVWSAVGAAFFLAGVAAQGNCCSLRGLFLSGAGVVVAPVAPRLELWFVWALGLFYVLGRCLRGVDHRLQLLAALALSMAATGHLELSNVGWTKAPQYWFFFLAGAHLRHLVLRVGAAGRVPTVAAVVAAAALAGAAQRWDLARLPVVPFVLAVCGVVLGVAASRVLRHLRVVPWLGARTLQVYVAHTPLVITAVVVLVALGRIDDLGPWAPFVVPVVAAVAVVLALALHEVPRLQVLYRQPGWLQELPVTVRRARGRGAAGRTGDGGPA
ncbi:acyltransferase family protein [Kineococcus sp. R8]|uniref:acyltransferase family protein n=1 Tax=Kineococcus siccus TaxID=2696567 RepID=UPI001412E9B0|nr:acyltransferase family protein [Kineococcus siccus]